MASAPPPFEFSVDGWEALSVTTIAVYLITSTYCYNRIFFWLRHQHTQVYDNLREEETQTTRRVDKTRYRKTVPSALWLQLALLFCYLPHLLLALSAQQKLENTGSLAEIKLPTRLSYLIWWLKFNEKSIEISRLPKL